MSCRSERTGTAHAALAPSVRDAMKLRSGATSGETVRFVARRVASRRRIASSNRIVVESRAFGCIKVHSRWRLARVVLVASRVIRGARARARAHRGSD